MDERDKNCLRKNIVYLVHTLETEYGLYNYLLQWEVLTDRQVDELRIAGTRQSQVERLIPMLLMAKPSAFDLFCQALDSTNQQHVKDHLLETCMPTHTDKDTDKNNIISNTDHHILMHGVEEIYCPDCNIGNSIKDSYVGSFSSKPSTSSAPSSSTSSSKDSSSQSSSSKCSPSKSTSTSASAGPSSSESSSSGSSSSKSLLSGSSSSESSSSGSSSAKSSSSGSLSSESPSSNAKICSHDTKMMHNLKIGDVLELKRWTITHFAMFVGNNNVIHHTSDCGVIVQPLQDVVGKSKAKIRELDINLVPKDEGNGIKGWIELLDIADRYENEVMLDDLQKLIYGLDDLRKPTVGNKSKTDQIDEMDVRVRELVVLRAANDLTVDEMEYNLISNNCEHIVNKWTMGHHISYQVEQWSFLFNYFLNIGMLLAPTLTSVTGAKRPRLPKSLLKNIPVDELQKNGPHHQKMDELRNYVRMREEL